MKTIDTRSDAMFDVQQPQARPLLELHTGTSSRVSSGRLMGHAC